MTDETLSPQDQQLLTVLKRGAADLWLVDGVEAGFDEEQARAVLASPTLMETLAEIGGDIEAGPGFVQAAIEQSERGRLNRRLLRQATRSRRSPGGARTPARYELGVWLKETPPGTGDPANPFDEALLDLELGALAWENARALASTDAARVALDGAGPTLLGLAVRIDGWTGWRRELADEVLLTACRAFVATHPDAQETPAVGRVIAALEVGGSAADAVDDGLVPVRASGRDAFALAAGGEGSEDVVLAGSVLIDPDQIEPRSVAPGWDGLWEVTEGAEVGLRIRVAVGDTPVEALTAHVTLDAVQFTVELAREDVAYDGGIVLDDVPGAVRVEATALDGEPSAASDDEIREQQEAIARVLEGRRAAYDGGAVNPLPLANRPFLCELVAWDPGL
ncbi:hypothetical protein SAMN02745244_02890 [Tessaracoccus bendigoensis DSM 12906]|uniref:Uncharacterized protein n=1 Tax=Tessaracoccus bendigoensis DSM 12906 TaxID=1123357 RepID=A0A1M6KQX1_9ACTN|nr:hypothetical protein [Tessaracoccus bendigoensis]SHJ61306.1 hypothetical protein SAMN02745244_02890 [Tessaracoccus bendigoensis DSM 12906]